MEITLCMIVKNEEKYIRMCLENAFNLVDKAVIVDTGSTDKTVEILTEFGSKVKIKYFEWNNDFSAARNYSIENVQSDWIIILDADEKLSCNPSKLRNLLSESRMQGYDIALESDVGRSTLISKVYVRLFKNCGYRYYRAIHEQLNIDQNAVKGLDDSICKIIHYGYSTDNLNDKKKIERNLNILLSEYRKNPKDALLCYHIGATYGARRDFELSLDYYFRCLELSPKTIFPTYHSTMYKMITLTYYELEQFEACIKFVNSIVYHKMHLKFVDLYFIKGLCLKQLKRYEEAEKLFNDCLKIGDNKEFDSIIGRGSFLARLELARIYRESGKNDLVVPNYVEAVLDPRNVRREGLNEFSDFLQEHDLFEIKDELDNLVGRTVPARIQDDSSS